MSTNSGQRGLSLIELVVFIVIVGVALAGIAAAINFNVRHSADPIVKKQALAIAESLLEEVELMPLTWCDQDDANVATAASLADCAALPENMGAEAGETRGSTASPFDNVNDYHGYAMASITDLSGAAIANLSGYTARVEVAAETQGSFAGGEALRITVTVSGPLHTTVVLEGYRARYAPNATL